MSEHPTQQPNIRHQCLAVPALERFYSVEVVASLSGVATATVRRYERLGLVEPAQTAGGPRRYTDREVERIRQIRRLSHDLGVSLAAVEVILHMRERMLDMQRELLDLKRRVRLE